jgi:hypothetical protein
MSQAGRSRITIPAKRRTIELAVTLKSLDLRTDDELLADTFLWGWGEADNAVGMISRRYFKKRAGDEARQALLRILRSNEPLSRTLRNHLAELFEIKSDIAERMLEFAFRPDRRRSNPMARRQISHFVALKEKEYAGQPKARTRAVLDAAEYFGVTTKTIWKHLKSPLGARKG